MRSVLKNLEVLDVLVHLVSRAMDFNVKVIMNYDLFLFAIY